MIGHIPYPIYTCMYICTIVYINVYTVVNMTYMRPYTHCSLSCLLVSLLIHAVFIYACVYVALQFQSELICVCTCTYKSNVSSHHLIRCGKQEPQNGGEEETSSPAARDKAATSAIAS